jgi:hypothetical protein
MNKTAEGIKPNPPRIMLAAQGQGIEMDDGGNKESKWLIGESPNPPRIMLAAQGQGIEIRATTNTTITTTRNRTELTIGIFFFPHPPSFTIAHGIVTLTTPFFFFPPTSEFFFFFFFFFFHIFLSFPPPQTLAHPHRPSHTAMFLKFYLDDAGKRVYTLKVGGLLSSIHFLILFLFLLSIYHSHASFQIHICQLITEGVPGGHADPVRAPRYVIFTLCLPPDILLFI